MPTASQLAQIRGNPYLQGLIDTTRTEIPVINSFDTYDMQGTRFRSLAVTGLPGASFLNMNEGYVSSEVTLSLAEFNAFRIGGDVKVPVSSTLQWNEENKLGAQLPYTFQTLQSEYKMKAMLRLVQQQIFSGTANDPKGFPGLKELTPFVSGNTYTLAEIPQDSQWARSVINAGGVTANLASSVYAVDFGPLKCCLRMGGPQGVAGFLKMAPWQTAWIEGADPVDGITKGQNYYISYGEGYVGLQLSGSNEPNATRKFRQDSVRRLANLTVLVPLTEAMLDQLIAAFPPGYSPKAFYMSYRSQKQLQDSKGTGQTIFVDAGPTQNPAFTQRAPLPTEHRGIPIIVTDAIGNADGIEA